MDWYQEEILKIHSRVIVHQPSAALCGFFGKRAGVEITRPSRVCILGAGNGLS